MAKRGKGLVGVGLFGQDAPQPVPQPLTIFQQADALLASKGWPQGAITEFNVFLGAYCKHRGKPRWEDVGAWVDTLERYRMWRMDFDDIRYLLAWCRQSGRYFITIPPEMRANGDYWFSKGQLTRTTKSGKVY